MGLSSKLSISSKSTERQPAASLLSHKKHDDDLHVPVSPKSTGSGGSAEDELQALRLRNKVLTEALTAIKETADKYVASSHDLVWFAKNRSRFPNHKDHKRIEEEHTEELKKLRTEDADYHHGLHTGCLAASRLFQSQSDILKINEYDEVSEEMMELAKEHSRKIAESLVAFPHVAVDQK